MGKAGRPFGTTKPGLKYLNESELERFFKAVDRSKNKRDMFAFRLVLFLGLRVSELVSLKLEDLNLESHQISVRGLKNGRQRVYDLNGRLSERLGVYLKLRSKTSDPKNPYLFPHPKRWDEHVQAQNIKHRFKTYVEQSGLDNEFSIHSLRHSIGIMMAKAGKSAIEIQMWLRHRSVQSTQVYFEQVRFEKQDQEQAQMFGPFL